MSRSRKVVLFYPPYDGPPLGAPLCLLALASPLLEAGFEVKLVDNLTSPDFENVILREAEDALCLGISILPGPMIGSAIRIAKKVRLTRPSLPIVFGGWHPTLVPEQTLKPDFVDAILRGPGAGATGCEHQRPAGARISPGKCGCLCLGQRHPAAGLFQQRGLPLRLQ